MSIETRQKRREERFEKLYATIDRQSMDVKVQEFFDDLCAEDPHVPAYENLTAARFKAVQALSLSIMRTDAPDLYKNLLTNGMDFIHFVAYKEARWYASQFFSKQIENMHLVDDAPVCLCTPRRDDPHYEMRGEYPVVPVAVNFNAEHIDEMLDEASLPNPLPWSVR